MTEFEKQFPKPIPCGGGISAEMLEAMIDYALTIGLEVVTTSELYDNVLS